MFLGVEMNVEDEVGEVAVTTDFYATKVLLEQAAGAVIGFVDALGVGGEKCGERAGWHV